MLIKSTGTMVSAWRKLNSTFLECEALSIVKSAGVYASHPMITIQGQGFGIPDSVLFRPERVKLLQARYVDADVTRDDIARYRRAPTGATHTFRFNRKGDRPKAGGCLLSIVLVRHNKKWQVMVNSRAEEITMALYADIQFLRGFLEELEKALDVDLDLLRIPITWHMGLGHQNRTFVPVFVYDALGSRHFWTWLKGRGECVWDKICIDHTHLMLKGEKVTGARKLWGRRLKEWTNGKRI